MCRFPVSTFISMFRTNFVVREFFRVTVSANGSPAIALSGSTLLPEIYTTGSAVATSGAVGFASVDCPSVMVT